MDIFLHSHTYTCVVAGQYYVAVNGQVSLGLNSVLSTDILDSTTGFSKVDLHVPVPMLNITMFVMNNRR